jgi:hypothetical protein
MKKLIKASKQTKDPKKTYEALEAKAVQKAQVTKEA